MIFLLWCGLHIITMLVMSLLVPRRPYWSLSFSECLIVALWYSVPFSALLGVSGPSRARLTVGFVMYVSGASLLTWARRSNPYFCPRIKIPTEVIRTGAYRWLRHPGYVGMSAMALGSALMAGAHVIGYLALALYCFVLMLRAQEEDRLIRSCQSRNGSLGKKESTPTQAG